MKQASLTTFGVVTVLAIAACCGPANPSAACQTPLTVHPVLLAGHASPEATDALGVLLERAGASDLTIATTAFAPDRERTPQDQAAAFAVFARDGGQGQALLADLLGTPGRGVDEVRGVLTDRAGNVLWQTRLRPGDPAFDRARPNEPMACLLLLVQELRPVLQLGDPQRSNLPPGPLATRLQAKAGVPDAAELQAMQQRLVVARGAGKELPLVVLPPRLSNRFDSQLAAQLADHLRRAGYRQVRAADQGLPYSSQASPNEQRVLWSAARSLRELQAKAGGTEYVVACDLLFGPGDQLGAVHTFLLAPNGELVWVDYQNDHHDDFRAMAGHAACDGLGLAATRLATALR